MATPKTVWGIDIGQVALKALKLRSVDGQLQVEAFDIIEHPQILSEPDVDRRQLVRSALEQFLAKHSVADSLLAVSVPGQSSFTRFVKLPPVDAKKIPDIVRYEAEQQIPFPIDEVIWQWQKFVDPDSPDMEVGIFAMKRTDVHEMLDRFVDVGLGVDIVQMAPLALYNFMKFDEQIAPEGATLLADVGADKTDLVVADGPRIWTRTIQIGGNNFTEALVRAFKLTFPKAERLKRTATTSKYAKQVFQAMRPVFADLVQEIQRSIGYYTALHRDTRFKRIVGMGNGFRLPGLQKFLEQNLNISVVPVDSYNRLTPSPAVSVPQWTENPLSFAVAYGLALQGLEQASVSTNLLPREIASKRTWARKRLWFAASAAALLAALAMPVFNNYRVKNVLADSDNIAKLNQAKNIVQEQQNNRSQQATLLGQIKQRENQIQQQFKLFNYRSHIPYLQAVLSASLADPQVAPQQAAFQQYVLAADEPSRQQALAAIKSIKRQDRQVFFVEKLSIEYSPNIASFSLENTTGPGGSLSNSASTAGPASQAPTKPGFRITMVGRTPLPQALVNEKLNQGVKFISREYAQKSGIFEVTGYRVMSLEAAIKAAGPNAVPVRAPTPAGVAPKDLGPLMPDPFIPDEDMADDTRFTVGWILAITEGTKPLAPDVAKAAPSAAPVAAGSSDRD